jgi:predicted secreted protein
MKKYILGAVLAFGVVVSPFVVRAQAVGLTQSQISAVISLLQSFGVDQSTVNSVESALGGTSTGTNSSCYNFTTNLSIGMSGTAVTALQTALRNDGESVTINGTFDDQTASAVTGFQQKYASSILTPNGLQYGTGYVGASTRAKLNSLCGTNPPIICPAWGCNGPEPTPTPISTTGPTITTASLPNGTIGVTYFASINGSNGSAVYSANNGYSWSISGLPAGLTNSLPAGMTGACEYGCSSTQISGTPTTAGTYTVTITLTSGGQTVSEQLSLIVGTTQPTQPLAITTTSLQSGTAGASYSTVLNGTGGSGTYNWSISGIPTGLSVIVDNCQTNPSSCASPMQARIVGTLPSSVGTYPVTVQLQSGAQTVSNQFNLVISSNSSTALQLTSSNNGGTVTLARGQNLQVTLCNPGDSGYQFNTPTYNASFLQLNSHNNIPSNNVAGSAGGCYGNDVWQFSALQSGTTNLTITATRPWTGGGTVTSFTTSIVIN